MPNYDDFDPAYTDLIRQSKSAEAVAFCKKYRKQAEADLKSGTVTQGEGQGMISETYSCSAFAHHILRHHSRAVADERKAIAIVRRVKLDYHHLQIGYKWLAQYLDADQRPEEARKARLRSLTCVMTRRQTAFVAIALSTMADAERTANRSQAADMLNDVAAGIQHESRWCSLNLDDQLEAQRLLHEP